MIVKSVRQLCHSSAAPFLGTHKKKNLQVFLTPSALNSSDGISHRGLKAGATVPKGYKGNHSMLSSKERN